MRKRRGASRRKNPSKRLKADEPGQSTSTSTVEPEPILGNKNPLLHSVVLRTLFGYFDVDDLKNARLVCRAWRETAATYLQDLSVVRLFCPDTGKPQRLTDVPNVANFNALRRVLKQSTTSYRLDTRNRPVSEYVDYLSGVPQNEIFHKNFIISCTVMSQQRRSERDVRNFWDLVGDQIESLRLIYCCIIGIDILNSILSFPKLRHVSLESSLVCKTKDFVTSTKQQIKLTPLQSDKFLNSHSNFKLTSFGLHGSSNLKCFPWTQLFAAFPNLKDIRVDVLSEEDMNNFLETLSKKAKETKITKLHFTPKDEFPGSVKQRLDSLKIILSTLKLERLSTQFYSRMEDQMFPSLLHQCSKTLKSLTLTRIPLSLGVPEIIQRQQENFDFRGSLFHGEYPVLKHLSIYHNFLSDLDEVTINCPNLEKLELVFSSSSTFIDGFNVQMRHDMLDKLQTAKENTSVVDLTLNVDYSNIFVSYSTSQQTELISKTLAQLGKFSNLKALRISLANSKEFKVVMKQVPNLEELTILGNSCYSTKDDDLIGSTNKNLPNKKLTKKRKKLPDTNNQGIGVFKNLRRLQMENDNRLLSHRAVTQGLIQLKNLRHLKIQNATEINVEAWGELSKLEHFIGVEAAIVQKKEPFSSSDSDSSTTSGSSSTESSDDSSDSD